MQLPKAFVQDDADRVREVQTADFAAGHGDAERAGLMPGDDLRRQAASFGSEQEAIAGLEIHVGVRAGGMGAQAA